MESTTPTSIHTKYQANRYPKFVTMQWEQFIEKEVVTLIIKMGTKTLKI